MCSNDIFPNANPLQEGQQYVCQTLYAKVNDLELIMNQIPLKKETYIFIISVFELSDPEKKLYAVDSPKVSCNSYCSK